MNTAPSISMRADLLKEVRLIRQPPSFPASDPTGTDPEAWPMRTMPRMPVMALTVVPGTDAAAAIATVPVPVIA